MSHKVVDTPTILSLCHKRPSKLSNGYKLAWQSFYKLIRDPDSSKNLPHQPRRPRGSRVDHDGWGVGVHPPAASTAPTRPVPGRVADSEILSDTNCKTGPHFFGL